MTWNSHHRLQKQEMLAMYMKRNAISRSTQLYGPECGNLLCKCRITYNHCLHLLWPKCLVDHFQRCETIACYWIALDYYWYRTCDSTISVLLHAPFRQRWHYTILCSQNAGKKSQTQFSVDMEARDSAIYPYTRQAWCLDVYRTSTRTTSWRSTNFTDCSAGDLRFVLS